MFSWWILHDCSLEVVLILFRGKNEVHLSTKGTYSTIFYTLLNTHCEIITKTLGCNSNIQMGSPRCVFYVIPYSTKSTQKEDRGIDYDRIGNQVMHRIECEREQIDWEIANGNVNASEEVNHFREGLCRFLIGMNIHMAQDVVSATMAHLLIS
jgi:hypothetical protein